MSIVLKENEWAEQMISLKAMDDSPPTTLRRIARYFIDKGYSKKGVIRELELFLYRYDPDVSIPKWWNTIEKAFKSAQKNTAINIESIPIYAEELDVIGKLKSVQLQRLAFTLLCLSKYWNIIRCKDNYWVNSPNSEIMKLANIKTSFKNQCILYNHLYEQGLIELSKKVDNTNVRVCFAHGNGEPVMNITDFRNLGYQYMYYRGGDFIECENCGLITKISSKDGNKRKQRYCPECATEIMLKQNVESVMRLRNVKKMLDVGSLQGA